MYRRIYFGSTEALPVQAIQGSKDIWRYSGGWVKVGIELRIWYFEENSNG